MKVIAHTSSRSALVEVTCDEFAKIMGLGGVYELRQKSGVYRDDIEALFPVGREVPIAKLWSIIEHERGRHGAIANTAKNLRALADMLETVNDALPSAEVAEKAGVAPASGVQP